MTRRSEQVASTVRGAVERVLARGLQDPRVAGLITITACDVSDDLSTAVLRVSVLPADKQDLTIKGLRAAARHIRHEISESVDLRRTPDLVFKLDVSLKNQAGVIDALAKVEAERRTRPDAPPKENTT